ncbi:Serine/threonine-protein kinase RIO3 [Aphelenchoides bicaudatus]|nr:Serine/threonine-protein kinase RIO3 [Aphelenchoides bicaudatus]
MTESTTPKLFSWAKEQNKNEVGTPPVTTLVEVMSETLANELQEQDLLEFDLDQEAIESSLRDLDVNQSAENDCSNDWALAMALQDDPDYSVDAHLALELQREFDRENELEQQLNENSVVTKRGTKFALAHDSFRYSKLEHELQNNGGEEDEDERREAFTDEQYSSKVQEFPASGFRKDDHGNIITKHNKEIGQQRNCQKIMQGFSTNFNSGDILDNKISSRIYNDLQMFSKGETKRNARLKDKETLATSDASVDVKTRLILLKWINAGDLDRIEGSIAIGKESTVLTGIRDAVEVGTSEEGPSEERHFAIKVHKQTLNAFRNRADYVKDDFRFKNPRSVLKIWTEKEFLNLRRVFKAGLPCPEPVQFKKHVLLMNLIEDETGRPAPKLKNYIWTSEQEKTEIFNQVKEILIKLYKECRLVHGDLSEFNLLFAKGKVYVIDIAQGCDLSHPLALVFLQRDIENVLNFFDKNATEGLPTAHELFTEITDIKVDAEKDLLSQIEAFNEQNLSVNVAMFRKQPGNYELVLADRERDAELNALNDEDSSEDEN